MARPEIRPPLFLALQNACAALLFTCLLAAETVRRMLYQYPDSATLWHLSVLANRTVMPVLGAIENMLPSPGRLMLGLLAGILVPLLAWWTRYWFATAVAGHVTLAALIIMTYSAFRRGNLALATLDLPDALRDMRVGPGAYLFLGLTVLLLVMCIADHVAFLRFLGTLRRRPAAGA